VAFSGLGILNGRTFIQFLDKYYSKIDKFYNIELI